MEPVVVRMTGSLVPHVALFAKQDILIGQELTFAYGPPNAGPVAGQDQHVGVAALEQQGPSCRARQCHCGTSDCQGYLPAEHV